MNKKLTANEQFGLKIVSFEDIKSKAKALGNPSKGEINDK